MKTLDEYLTLAAQNHGHMCPGQVLGVRMAMLGLKKLGIDDPAKYGKRLMTFVEIDRCATDALSLVNTTQLIPCESVRTVDFAPRLQNGVELKGIELARAVVLHFELGIAVSLDGQLVALPAQFHVQSDWQTVSPD